jgi:hypothetical protein
MGLCPQGFAPPPPLCRFDWLAWLCHVRQRVVVSRVGARKSRSGKEGARTYRCMRVGMHGSVGRANVEA